MKLLSNSMSNPKTALGDHDTYEAMLLHLAPGNLSGYEACTNRSVGCTFACLNTAGHGGIGGPDNAVQRARIRKTRWFFEDRDAFMAQLVRELELLVKRADRNGRIPVMRLNATSDILWEHVPCSRGGERFANVFAAFPQVIFYDYTKVIARTRTALPANYRLTFSVSECNDAHALKAVDRGFNIAVVLRLGKHDAMPEKWAGLPVVDGTTHDFRFLDPRGGFVVGLRPKGRAIKDTSGFVRDLESTLDASKPVVLAVAEERKGCH